MSSESRTQQLHPAGNNDTFRKEDFKDLSQSSNYEHDEWASTQVCQPQAASNSQMKQLDIEVSTPAND